MDVFLYFLDISYIFMVDTLVAHRVSCGESVYTSLDAFVLHVDNAEAGRLGLSRRHPSRDRCGFVWNGGVTQAGYHLSCSLPQGIFFVLVDWGYRFTRITFRRFPPSLLPANLESGYRDALGMYRCGAL